MKKIFVAIMATFALILSANDCAAQMNGTSVIIPFDLIDTDAALKQFKRASKINQLEIINNFLREANAQYKACDDIDEIRELRENVALINRYIVSGKQSFMSVQKEYNILYNKINKSIREYEGGSTVYSETGGFYDFEQAD